MRIIVVIYVSLPLPNVAVQFPPHSHTRTRPFMRIALKQECGLVWRLRPGTCSHLRVRSLMGGVCLAVLLCFLSLLQLLCLVSLLSHATKQRREEATIGGPHQANILEVGLDNDPHRDRKQKRLSQWHGTCAQPSGASAPNGEEDLPTQPHFMAQL